MKEDEYLCRGLDYSHCGDYHSHGNLSECPYCEKILTLADLNIGDEFRFLHELPKHEEKHSPALSKILHSRIRVVVQKTNVETYAPLKNDESFHDKGDQVYLNTTKVIRHYEEHVPYKDRLNRLPNFRVKYSFLNEESGGRKTLPHQGIRFDFQYVNSPHVYMIWPEFEKESIQMIAGYGHERKHTIILDRKKPVDFYGTALMWIVNDKMIDFHKNLLKPGIRGYFKEGGRIVAECEIIEVF